MTSPDRPVAAWEVFADVVLQRAALVARILRGEPPRPLRGLVVDDDEVRSLLDELPGLTPPHGGQVDDLLAATQAQVDEAIAALFADAGSSPFGAIVRNAALDDDSAAVLAMAVAIERHPARQLLVGYVNDDVSRRWLTPATIEQALGTGALRALGADEPLARAALTTVEVETGWSSAAVRPAAMVVAALAGAAGRDPELPRDARVASTGSASGDRMVLVHGQDRSDRLVVAMEATAGTHFLVCAAPADDAGWAAVVRQCVVGGFSAVIDVGPSAGLRDLDRWWIDRAGCVPIAVCSTNELRLDSLPMRPFKEVAAASSRRDVGGHVLDRHQAELVDQMLSSFDGDADAAVRRLVTGNLDAHASRTRPGRRWGELVLPDAHLQLLRELVARYRHRHRVYAEWGFPARPSIGVTALFAGPSGTGKTMTAEVIASELGLDLYRIDLSAVVSKYIGETEKNLEEIFTASAAGNMVLFFDEADALFGKRSEVADAHDRYANIEVAYLLQRLERYDGFVVLATNLRNNIDQAFLRRIDLALEFELPDVAQREAIWRGIFPPAAPLDGVDHRALAEEFEVAGGAIRNAAVHAAFLAADEGASIAMDHVLVGMGRELQKLGRLRAGAAMERLREVAHAAPAR